MVINRRRILQSGAAAAALLSAPAIVRGQAARTLRFGHIFPETHPYHKGLVKFAEEVAARTDGSVEVIVYSSGQLGGEIQMLEGMNLGSIDGGSVAAGSLAQTHGIRKFYLLDMPYLFQDYDAIERFVASDVAAELAAEVQPEVHGVRTLAWGGNGFSQMINSSRPIYGPADLEGLKFRVWESPSAIMSFEVMGLNPTPMPYSEVFTALQQGVVDGLVNSMTTLYLTKMHEVAQYLSVSDQLYAFLFIAMSEQSFAALDPAQQEAVLASAEVAAQFWRAIYPVNDAEYRGLLADAGCEVNDVDKPAFREYCQSRYDRYLEIVQDPGAEELMDKLLAFAQT
jgi:tripartite ATP-independent transporter DctP family solute receptor